MSAYEKIAEEALADAGYWKSEARRLAAENATLRQAARHFLKLPSDRNYARLSALADPPRAAIAKAKGNL